MTRVLKARQPGQKARRSAVVARPKADPNKPSAVRIVEHALRAQKWPASARREIVRLIKAGSGDAPFVHDEGDAARLTENDACPTSGVTHARCCECQGLNLDALGPPALRDAADPIDE